MDGGATAGNTKGGDGTGKQGDTPSDNNPKQGAFQIGKGGPKQGGATGEGGDKKKSEGSGCC